MSRVTILVDPLCGDRLAEVATQVDHVWIADTPENRATAHRRWAEGHLDVTTFKVSAPFDPSRETYGILGQVLLHHPDAAEIRVIGCHSNDQLRHSFEAEGFRIAAENIDGFVALSGAGA